VIQKDCYRENAELWSSLSSTYDQAGLEVERIFYGADRRIKSRTFFSYDAHSRLLSEREYRPDGSLGRMQEYAYDDIGNLMLQEELYNAEGVLLSRDTYDSYEVDPRGNWIKRKKTCWSYSNSANRESVSVSNRTIEYY
jgi:hypothetical protein